MILIPDLDAEHFTSTAFSSSLHNQIMMKSTDIFAFYTTLHAHSFCLRVFFLISLHPSLSTNNFSIIYFSQLSLSGTQVQSKLIQSYFFRTLNLTAVWSSFSPTSPAFIMRCLDDNSFAVKVHNWCCLGYQPNDKYFLVFPS